MILCLFIVFVGICITTIPYPTPEGDNEAQYIMIMGKMTIVLCAVVLGGATCVILITAFDKYTFWRVERFDKLDFVEIIVYTIFGLLAFCQMYLWPSDNLKTDKCMAVAGSFQIISIFLVTMFKLHHVCCHEPDALVYMNIEEGTTDLSCTHAIRQLFA